MIGTQERVSAAFLFDSYEMRDCFLIRPALCTRLVIKTRIPLKFDFGDKNGFKINSKETGFKSS